jgi:phasin
MAQSDFEVPAQVRELMEKSVEQARSAFETFSGAAQKTVGSIEPMLPSGAKEVNGKVFSYSQANIEAAFDFAQKLVHAKDPQEFMQLHSDFAKMQIETLQQQAKELGAAVQKAMAGPSEKSADLS